MRGRLAEFVADDAVDGRLRSVGLTIREIFGGQRGSAANLFPQAGGMISNSSVMLQSELGAHDRVCHALDNLFLVERFEVARRRFADGVEAQGLMLLPRRANKAGALLGLLRFTEGKVSAGQLARGRLGLADIILEHQIVPFAAEDDIVGLSNHFNLF